jgi:hypothetical protein
MLRDLSSCPRPPRRLSGRDSSGAHWERNLASADRTSAATAMASGSVPPCGGTSEEAATPGQPARASRVLRTPPAIHPRELPVNRCTTAVFPANVQGQLTLSASTLRHRRLRRNGKTFTSCAETVDGCASLWNPQENRGEILKPYRTQKCIFRRTLLFRHEPWGSAI